MFGGQDALGFPRDGRTVEERTRSKEWKQRVSTSRSQLSQWQGDRQGSAMPFPMGSLVGAGQGTLHSRQGQGKNPGITEPTFQDAMQFNKEDGGDGLRDTVKSVDNDFYADPSPNQSLRSSLSASESRSPIRGPASSGSIGNASSSQFLPPGAHPLLGPRDGANSPRFAGDAPESVSSGGYGYAEERGTLGNSRPVPLEDTRSLVIDDALHRDARGSALTGKLQGGGPIILPPEARLSTTRERFSMEERHANDLANMAREVDNILMSTVLATSPIINAVSAMSPAAHPLASPQIGYELAPLPGVGDAGRDADSQPMDRDAAALSCSNMAENGNGNRNGPAPSPAGNRKLGEVDADSMPGKDNGHEPRVDELTAQLAEAMGRADELAGERERLAVLLGEKQGEVEKMKLIVQSYEEGYQKLMLHPEMVEDKRRDAEKIRGLEKDLIERKRVSDERAEDSWKQIQHLNILLDKKQKAFDMLDQQSKAMQLEAEAQNQKLIAEHERTVAQFRGELREKEEAAKAQQAEIVKAMAESAEMQLKLKHANSKAAEAQRSMRAEIDAVTKSLAGTRAQARIGEGRHAAAASEMQIAATRLRDELALAQKRGAGLQQSVLELQAQLSKARQVEGAMVETLEKMEVTAGIAEMELSRMWGEVEGINARLLGAKDRRVELVFALNKSLEMEATLSQRVLTLQEEANGHEEKLRRVEEDKAREVKDLKDHFAASKGKYGETLDAFKAEVVGLKGMVDELRKGIDSRDAAYSKNAERWDEERTEMTKEATGLSIKLEALKAEQEGMVRGVREEMEEEMEGLRKSVEGAEARRGAADAEKLGVSQELVKAKQEIEEVEKEVERLGKELEEAGKESVRIDGEWRRKEGRLKMEIDEWAKRVGDVEGELAKEREDGEAARKKGAEELASRIKEGEDKYKAVVEERDAREKVLKAEVESWKGKNKEALDRLEALRKLQKSTAEQLDASKKARESESVWCKEQLGQSEEALAETTASLKAAEAQAAKFEAEAKNRGGENADLTKKLKAVSEKAGALDAKVPGLEMRVKEGDERLKELEEALTKSEQQSAEAETLAAAAEERLKNSEAKLTDSRQRVSTLEGKIHVIEAEQVRMKSKLVQSEKMVDSLTQQIDDELAKSSEVVRELSAVKTSLEEVKGALVLSEAREQDTSSRYMKVKDDSEKAEKRRLQQIKHHLFKRKASAAENVLEEDGKKVAIVDVEESQSLDSINVEVSSIEVERELEIKFKEVEEMENSIRGEREAMRAQLEDSRATLSSERKRMVEREQQLLHEMLSGKEEQAALFTELKKQVDDGNTAIHDLQKNHMEELGILQQHIKELNECNLELEEHLKDAESRIQELGRAGQLKCERIEQKMTKQLETERKTNKERIEKIETDTRDMLQKKIAEVRKAAEMAIKEVQRSTNDVVAKMTDEIKRTREDAVAQTREEAQKQAQIAADEAKKEREALEKKLKDASDQAEKVREGLEKKLKDASDQAEKVREGLESKFKDAGEKLEEAVARSEAAEAKHNAFVSGMKWTPPSPEGIGKRGADGEEGTVRGHAVTQRDLDMCRGHVDAAIADVQADLERMAAWHAMPRVVGKGTPQKVAQKVAPR